MSYLTYIILKGFAMLVVGTGLVVGGSSLLACIANFFSDLNDNHPKECKILGVISLVCLVLAAIIFLVLDFNELVPHLPISGGGIVEQ